MATVDEILARQAYAAGDDIWTEDSRYPSYRLYVEPEYVTITNKRIDDFNDRISVRGEQNARFVGFQMPRYDDGIDLTAQHLYIHHQTVYGGGDSAPCNVSKSDNYVRMCWMIPAQATQAAGAIQMMLYATGTNSAGEHVSWKTLPASYTIHDGLEIGGGIPEPDTSWYEQFVQQMEDQVSTAQGYADDAQASRTDAAGSAVAAAQSATASAKALEDNRAYVESQKETFVGYNKRETDLKYANALVGSASGMGRVSIVDAWEAPIPGMDISGRSEQVVMTGAQMLNIPSRTVKTQSGITFTPQADGTVIATGTATGTAWLDLWEPTELPLGEYYIAGCPKDGSDSKYQIVVYKVNEADYGWVAADNGNGTSFSVVDDRPIAIRAILRTGMSTLVVFKPMLNAGNTPKPWEPYTGGKPSPSPEYPQPIKGSGTVSTGAQILNLNVVKKQETIAGITFTIDSQNGTITANGTATEVGFLKIPSSIPEGEKIYIGAGNTSVVPNVNPQVILRLSGDNGVEVSSNTYLTTQHATNIFTTTQHCNFLHFRFGDKEVMNNFVIKPMVARSDKPLPWEPYTEGKPSPSPEYPQSLDVTVTGKNLTGPWVSGAADAQGNDTTYANAIRTGYIAVDPQKHYTFTKKLPFNKQMCMIRVYDAQKRFLGTRNGLTSILFEKTIKDGFYFKDAAFIRLSQYKDDEESFEGLCMQMEEGDIATEYEAPVLQTAAITLTAPLHGIGDVRDRIMCRDGVWGVERWIKEVVLNGSANEVWRTYSSEGISFYIEILDSIKEMYSSICNKYRNVAYAWKTEHKNKTGIYSDHNDNVLKYFRPPNTDVQTVEQWREWLSANPLTMVYQRSTPTWEPLPSDTQSALNALTTYTGTTHVTITAGGPEPDVGLGYVMDTRAVIADLQAQIDAIRNGGTT